MITKTCKSHVFKLPTDSYESIGSSLASLVNVVAWKIEKDNPQCRLIVKDVSLSLSNGEGQCIATYEAKLDTSIPEGDFSAIWDNESVLSNIRKAKKS